MIESASIPVERLSLRPACEVMELERLGSLHAGRLSFVRSLMRQMAQQRWKISCQRFELDDEGHGTVIYRLQTPYGRYHGLIFSRAIADEARSDRVIAEAWDVTFGVIEGDVDELLLDQMAANVPLQEAGRQNPRLLVLSRANKSMRNFKSFVEALASGKQPRPEWLTKVGYLYRTTAVYGNGKFGIADYELLQSNPDFRRPFSAQMLAVYLLRHFSVEQLEHLARVRAPQTAVTLTPELRRYIGIGNSTGLGMAPFLINHPQLIQQWVSCRERALAMVLTQNPTEALRHRLISLCRRAMTHLAQTLADDVEQMQRNGEIVAALPAVINWLEEVPLESDLWQQLVNWSRRTLSLEAQELIVTVLIELYPELIDPLEDAMGTHEALELTPDMPLVQLRQLIETHYDWALDQDYDAPEACYWFWYRSVEKEEPRLGIRYHEQGADRELPLAIAPHVQKVHQAVCGYLDTTPRALVINFLIAYPRYKAMVRRIQSLSETTYGEIRANLWHRDMKPMHLLRTKLSFFGASRFDPRSDRWVRVTLFQGAPLAAELNAEPNDLAAFDDWSFPLEPELEQPPDGSEP